VNNIKWGVMAAIAAVILSVGIGLISHVAFVHVLLRALIFAIVFFAIGFGLRFLINTFFPELLFMDDGSSAPETFDQPGSVVNIVMDNSGEYAVPELYKTPGDPNELGNIDDLISGVFRPRSSSTEQVPSAGIDGSKKERYNVVRTPKFDDDFPSFQDIDDFGFQEMDAYGDTEAEEPKVEKPKVEKQGLEKPIFTPSFGDDAGVGGLPDLEMFAMAFSGGAERTPMQPIARAEAPSAMEQSIQPQMDDFEPTQPQSRYVSSKPTPMKGDFDAKELAKGISTVLSKDK